MVLVQKVRSLLHREIWRRTDQKIFKLLLLQMITIQALSCSSQPILQANVLTQRVIPSLLHLPVQLHQAVMVARSVLRLREGLGQPPSLLKDKADRGEVHQQAYQMMTSKGPDVC